MDLSTLDIYFSNLEIFSQHGSDLMPYCSALRNDVRYHSLINVPIYLIAFLLEVPPDLYLEAAHVNDPSIVTYQKTVIRRFYELEAMQEN